MKGNTMPKRYADITDDDLQAIASSWDQESRFSRHTIVWLAEQGFNWDHGKTDAENRADFERIELDALAKVGR